MRSLNLPPSRVVLILEERQKAEVRQKALQDVLRTLLRQRFHDLPAWTETRINTASEDLLQRWLLRFVDARSVEDVLVPDG